MKFNKRNILIATGATLFAGGLTWVLINRHNKKKDIQLINDVLDGNKSGSGSGSSGSGGQVVIPKSTYDKLPDGKFPLKIGDKNKKVYEIQRLLNKNFGTSIDLDGAYGQQTWDAMCNNLWNKGFTVKDVACYDVHATSLPTKRAITETDYETLKNLKAKTS